MTHTWLWTLLALLSLDSAQSQEYDVCAAARSTLLIRRLTMSWSGDTQRDLINSAMESTSCTSACTKRVASADCSGRGSNPTGFPLNDKDIGIAILGTGGFGVNYGSNPSSVNNQYPFSIVMRAYSNETNDGVLVSNDDGTNGWTVTCAASGKWKFGMKMENGTTISVESGTCQGTTLQTITAAVSRTHLKLKVDSGAVVTAAFDTTKPRLVQTNAVNTCFGKSGAACGGGTGFNGIVSSFRWYTDDTTATTPPAISDCDDGDEDRCGDSSRRVFGGTYEISDTEQECDGSVIVAACTLGQTPNGPYIGGRRACNDACKWDTTEEDSPSNCTRGDVDHWDFTEKLTSHFGSGSSITGLVTRTSMGTCASPSGKKLHGITMDGNQVVSPSGVPNYRLSWLPYAFGMTVAVKDPYPETAMTVLSHGEWSVVCSADQKWQVTHASLSGTIKTTANCSMSATDFDTVHITIVNASRFTLRVRNKAGTQEVVTGDLSTNMAEFPTATASDPCLGGAYVDATSCTSSFQGTIGSLSVYSSDKDTPTSPEDCTHANFEPQCGNGAINTPEGETCDGTMYGAEAGTKNDAIKTDCWPTGLRKKTYVCNGTCDDSHFTTACDKGLNAWFTFHSDHGVPFEFTDGTGIAGIVLSRGTSVTNHQCSGTPAFSTKAATLGGSGNGPLLSLSNGKRLLSPRDEFLLLFYPQSTRQSFSTAEGYVVGSFDDWELVCNTDLQWEFRMFAAVTANNRIVKGGSCNVTQNVDQCGTVTWNPSAMQKVTIKYKSSSTRLEMLIDDTSAQVVTDAPAGTDRFDLGSNNVNLCLGKKASAVNGICSATTNIFTGRMETVQVYSDEGATAPNFPDCESNGEPRPADPTPVTPSTPSSTPCEAAGCWAQGQRFVNQPGQCCAPGLLVHFALNETDGNVKDYAETRGDSYLTINVRNGQSDVYGRAGASCATAPNSNHNNRGFYFHASTGQCPSVPYVEVDEDTTGTKQLLDPNQIGIEVLFRPTAVNRNDSQYILHKMASASSGYSLSCGGGDNQPGSATLTFRMNSQTYNLGSCTEFAWHHVVITRNGRRITWFVNGARTTNFVALLANPGNTNTNANLCIGAMCGGGSPFDGTVDTVRIWSDVNLALAQYKSCPVDCSAEPTNAATTANPNAACGNGILEPGEECDASLQRPCASLGCTSSCNPTCNSATTGATACKVDRSANCVAVTPPTNNCGDGNIDAGEECDGAAINDQICGANSYPGGGVSGVTCFNCSATCTSSCKFTRENFWGMKLNGGVPVGCTMCKTAGNGIQDHEDELCDTQSGKPNSFCVTETCKEWGLNYDNAIAVTDVPDCVACRPAPTKCGRGLQFLARLAENPAATAPQFTEESSRATGAQDGDTLFNLGGAMVTRRVEQDTCSSGSQKTWGISVGHGGSVAFSVASGNSMLLNPLPPLAIDVRVKLTNPPGVPPIACRENIMVAAAMDTSVGQGYSIGCKWGKWTMWGGTTSGVVALESTTDCTADTWTRVVGVFDGLRFKIYKDSATAAIASSSADVEYSFAKYGSSGAPNLCIGSFGATCDEPGMLYGEVDNVRVWSISDWGVISASGGNNVDCGNEGYCGNGVRDTREYDSAEICDGTAPASATPSAIQTTCTANTCTSGCVSSATSTCSRGLLAHFDFAERTGAPADQLARNGVLSISGTVTRRQNVQNCTGGKMLYGFELDGSSDLSSTSAGLNVGTSLPFTVEVSATRTGTGAQTVAAREDRTNKRGWRIQCSAAGKWEFIVGVGTGSCPPVNRGESNGGWFTLDSTVSCSATTADYITASLNRVEKTPATTPKQYDYTMKITVGSTTQTKTWSSMTTTGGDYEVATVAIFCVGGGDNTCSQDQLTGVVNTLRYHSVEASAPSTNPDCSSEPQCGDSVVNRGETCDGATSSACTAPANNCATFGLVMDTRTCDSNTCDTCTAVTCKGGRTFTEAFSRSVVGSIQGVAAGVATSELRQMALACSNGVERGVRFSGSESFLITSSNTNRVMAPGGQSITQPLAVKIVANVTDGSGTNRVAFQVAGVHTLACNADNRWEYTLNKDGGGTFSALGPASASALCNNSAFQKVFAYFEANGVSGRAYVKVDGTAGAATAGNRTTGAQTKEFACVGRLAGSGAACDGGEAFHGVISMLRVYSDVAIATSDSDDDCTNDMTSAKENVCGDSSVWTGPEVCDGASSAQCWLGSTRRVGSAECINDCGAYNTTTCTRGLNAHFPLDMTPTQTTLFAVVPGASARQGGRSGTGYSSEQFGASGEATCSGSPSRALFFDREACLGSSSSVVSHPAFSITYNTLYYPNGEMGVGSWFKLLASADGTARDIVSAGTSTSGYKLECTATNTFKFSYYTTSLQSVEATTFTNCTAASGWLHVVAVASPGSKRIYVNGVLAISEASTLEVVGAGSGTVNLGGAGFNGWIDNVKIFSSFTDAITEASAANNDCTVESSPAQCGDGRIVGTEQCEPGVAVGTPTTAECNAAACAAGCAFTCLPNCMRAFTTCTPLICGDGTVDPNEACDLTSFKSADVSACSGTLRCNNDCTLDNSTCTCGDGTLQTWEECDGSNLDGKNCTSANKGSAGTLGCTNKCVFDGAQCTGSTVETVSGQFTLTSSTQAAWDNLTTAEQDAIKTSLAADIKAALPASIRASVNPTVNIVNGNVVSWSIPGVSVADTNSVSTAVNTKANDGTLFQASKNTKLNDITGGNYGVGSTTSCGNNVKEGSEECDGTDNPALCADGETGTPGCSSCVVDRSSCTAPPSAALPTHIAYITTLVSALLLCLLL